MNHDELIEQVRKDLARPVEEWSEQDREDYKAVFGRLPPRKSR